MIERNVYFDKLVVYIMFELKHNAQNWDFLWTRDWTCD